MNKKNIFVKFSNDRAPQFCVLTKIVRVDGKKYVRKEPENSEAEAHTRNIVKNGKLLSEKYQNSNIQFAKSEWKNNAAEIIWVEGRSFAEHLDDLLERGDTEECLKSMNKYFQQIYYADTYRCQKEIIEWNDTITVSNIDVDMLFQNVLFLSEEEKWICYDYEWFFTCDISMKFFIYRCLLYYLTTEKRILALGNDIYAKFDIDDNDINRFNELETQLQKHIAGNSIPLWKLYDKMQSKSIPVLSMIEEKRNDMRAQVYYDTGQGFRECESSWLFPEELEDRRFRVKLQYANSTRKVRFDPSESPCLLQVERLKNQDGSDIPYVTNGIDLDGGNYLFLHNDSQIQIESLSGVQFIDLEYSMTLINNRNLGGLSNQQQRMMIEEARIVKLEEEKKKVETEKLVLEEEKAKLEEEKKVLEIEKIKLTDENKGVLLAYQKKDSMLEKSLRHPKRNFIYELFRKI